MLNTLAEVHEYVQSSVAGWCSKAEGAAYYALAQQTQGQIVELGVFHGKSLMYFAAGYQGDKPIIGIDTFGGVPSKGYKKYMDFPVAEMWDKCKHHLKVTGLQEKINLLAQPTLPALAYLKPISLLYIDADHEFESVMKDFHSWFPLVSPGGVIVLHDIDTNEGPATVYRANIMTGSLINHHRVDHCGIGIKGDGPLPTAVEYDKASHGIREWAGGKW